MASRNLRERRIKTMYETIPTLHMGHEEWLKLRKTGIGGSDAAAVCGLNPYASPMSIYKDKTEEGVTAIEDNESMRQGRDLEDYVARRFCEATGFKVRRSHMLYRSKEHPFMIADVDRLIAGRDAGLECKTDSAYSADKWADGKIPPHYLIQCLHYMAVTGKKEWYIAVAILGKDFKYAKLSWNDKLIQDLITIEQRFWENHIVPRVMPKPDGSDACEEILKQYFGTAQKGTAIPLVGFDEKLGRRAEILALMKQLEQEQKQIEQEIKLFMGENETACSDSYRVTWANIDTTRLDTEKIRAERPDIYHDFGKTTSYRKFTIKAA